MDITNDQLNNVKKILGLEFDAQNLKSLQPDGLADFLEASEKRFIAALNHEPSAGGGASEFALARYHLQNSFQELLQRDMLNVSERQNMETISSSLKLERTLITTKHLESAELEATVGDDGSIYGTGTYENLDFGPNNKLGWATCVPNYLISLWNKHKFVVQTNTAGIPITPNSIKIAIVGDWGTGNYTNRNNSVNPAQQVLNSMAKQNPDYTIHLGDVYYNGTSSTQTIIPDEENTNFINVWTLPNSKGLTLNSNHEMYAGGYGYFQSAMASSKFSLQQGASYFALVHEKWVLFGLDSAYYDTSSMYMDGAVTDSNQLNFIKGINTAGKKVIVMTHHNPINDNGNGKKGNLWANINSALGGKDPDFWYWGHTHNAIVYNNKADVGSTIARCVGHGAIPFTKAPELYQADGSNNPEIAYYAGQELPVQPVNGGITLANNGYAILTITADSLTEVFYDQNGNALWAPPPYKFG